jgi:hypothetical protein
MVPSQPQKVATQVDVVEVLMPCSTLLDPLRDLDGDGTFDCKITQEQHEVAVSISELDGTWHIVSAQSVSSESLSSEDCNSQDSITIGGGAWCVDSSETAQWEYQLNELDKEKLPLALTNVAHFNNDAKPCRSEEACEATMWTFDLAYPVSSCTPGIAGWVQPCSAKLLADGTLVLVRGAPVQTGSTVRRPPLLVSVAHVADALPFANGLAVATQSSFKVLLLHKHHGLLRDAFRSQDAHGNGIVPMQHELQSNSNYDEDTHSTDEVRQLQSINMSFELQNTGNSSNSNSSDDDNETITVTTSTPTPTTTTTTTTNTITITIFSPATIITSTTTAFDTTETTTAKLSELNNSHFYWDHNNTENSAEIAQACSLRVWSSVFFCLTLCLLIH